MAVQNPPVSSTYHQAGVHIDAGNELVKRIQSLAAKTRRPEILADIGGFAGLCKLPKLTDPVLVAGTDGVGTKLKLAFLSGKHDTVGIDLVAMCANDVATTGADPLFFLDYFATGKLDVDVAERVIAGIAEGCRQAGCALLGGETAELPGFYQPGEYDLAGFCVGVVERAQILDGRRIVAGDRLVGIASSGLHSNGYSLARAVLPLDDPTMVTELLKPTRIYVNVIQTLLAAVDVRGIAHITGGGLVENPRRMLPADSPLRLDIHYTWSVPSLFLRIQQAGSIAEEEMRRTFNLGVGLVVCVPPSDVPRAISTAEKVGECAFEMGEVVKT